MLWKNYHCQWCCFVNNWQFYLYNTMYTHVGMNVCVSGVWTLRRIANQSRVYSCLFPTEFLDRLQPMCIYIYIKHTQHIIQGMKYEEIPTPKQTDREHLWIMTCTLPPRYCLQLHLLHLIGCLEGFLPSYCFCWPCLLFVHDVTALYNCVWIRCLLFFKFFFLLKTCLYVKEMCAFLV